MIALLKNPFENLRDPGIGTITSTHPERRFPSFTLCPWPNNLDPNVSSFENLKEMPSLNEVLDILFISQEDMWVKIRVDIKNTSM